VVVVLEDLADDVVADLVDLLARLRVNRRNSRWQGSMRNRSAREFRRHAGPDLKKSGGLLLQDEIHERGRIAGAEPLRVPIGLDRITLRCFQWDQVQQRLDVCEPAENLLEHAPVAFEER
jgi:hypothetical protein